MLLIQALGDIQIAIKALHEEEESLEHPIDKHYKSLNCSLTPLDRESDDFKVRFSFYFSLPLIWFVSDPLPKSIRFDWLSLLCTAVWMSQGGSYAKSMATAKSLSLCSPQYISFSHFTSLFRRRRQNDVQMKKCGSWSVRRRYWVFVLIKYANLWCPRGQRQRQRQPYDWRNEKILNAFLWCTYKNDRKDNDVWTVLRSFSFCWYVNI